MPQAHPALLSSVAQGMIQRVTFRSQVTPEYSYDPWAPSPTPPPGQSSWLMEAVRPEVTIDTPSGPVVVAPYGSPEANYFPLVALGGVAAVVGLVVLIGWVARATKR